MSENAINTIHIGDTTAELLYNEETGDLLLEVTNRRIGETGVLLRLRNLLGSLRWHDTEDRKLKTLDVDITHNKEVVRAVRTTTHAGEEPDQLPLADNGGCP